jgi:hypothetical protein
VGHSTHIITHNMRSTGNVSCGACSIRRWHPVLLPDQLELDLEVLLS